MWVLALIAVVVLVSSVLALRAGTHPGKGHCGPMCTLGNPASGGDDGTPADQPSSVAPPDRGQDETGPA